MTTTPPLDKSSDTVVYDISDQEDLETDKCSSDLHEIYECSKKICSEMQLTKGLLTAAEKKFITQTKTNLDKYKRILSAIECKGLPAVHRQKARVVNAQPDEQDGGSGNDEASSESESGEDLIECSLCDKFYLTEESKTRHFK